MTAPIDRVLPRLQNVNQAGRNQWEARCPAHDDKRASLSVSTGSDGTVLLKCHAGCTVNDITAALGLTVRDLFPSNGGKQKGKRKRGRIVAEYPYHDENGSELFCVHRFDPKDFRQSRPGPNENRIWKMTGCRRVPYRLPELLKAAREGGVAFVVEGEKDVDRLQWFHPATCNPGGAGKWRPEYSEHFRGLRQVAIIPDGDEPGQRHAQQVAAALVDVVPDIRIVELPDAKDISSWLDTKGNTIGKLMSLVRETTPWVPVEPEPTSATSTHKPDPVDPLAAMAGLTDESTTADLGDALRSFGELVADLDGLERELARAEAVKIVGKLGHKAPARLVDQAMPIQVRDDPGSGTELLMQDPQPWNDPVDGAALLDELVAAARRFVVFPEGGAEAVALWCVHAHAHDAFHVSPFLVFTSPEKRCGKTRGLELVARLVPRPLPASNITPAALFRAVEKFRPSLLLDEAETFTDHHEELRGILNSGHTRGGAFVVRTVGEEYEPRAFSTWCPKAVGLIGTLPSTIEDRSIIVRMRRKDRSEEVELWRADRASSELTPLCRRAARWARDNLDALRSAEPDVPHQITSDRAMDNWRPLLAIADLAGGEWPDKARQVAVQLAGEASEESARVLLLEDLHRLFTERQTDRITSKDVVVALTEMEDRPWPEWRQGKAITTRQVARLLKPFDVAPSKYRDGDATVRGYLSGDFADVFRRYLGGSSGNTGSDDIPPVYVSPGPGISSGTKEQTSENMDLWENRSGTKGVNVPDRNSANHPETWKCSVVPDRNPDPGGEHTSRTSSHPADDKQIHVIDRTRNEVVEL